MRVLRRRYARPRTRKGEAEVVGTVLWEDHSTRMRGERVYMLGPVVGERVLHW